MSIMRSKTRLSASAQLPSPIPTAKGLRSAAVDDRIFSEYLEKSLQVPQLTLPEPYLIPVGTPRSVPREIDFQSLVSRDGSSVEQVLHDAAHFGVFRVTGHAISVDELRSLAADADWVFRISDEKKANFRRVFRGCNHFREELVWLPSQKAMVEWADDVVEAEKCLSFSRKMDDISSKLEAIAEELCQIISESARKQRRNEMEVRESVMSLYRCCPYNQTDQNTPGIDGILESSHQTLVLHLPIDEGEFMIQSKQGPLSFRTGPHTVVVCVGQLLEEWSLGEVEPASGEMVFERPLHGSAAPLCVELKCSALNLSHNRRKMKKTISIPDQILIALIVYILFKFYAFISSWFQGYKNLDNNTSTF